MSLRDDINVPVVVVLGLVTGLIVAVAIVGTQAGYNYVRHAELERNYTDAEANNTLSLGKQVWAQQEDAVKKAAGTWADDKKTTVHLSMERAKQVFIDAKGVVPAAVHPATQPNG